MKINVCVLTASGRLEKHKNDILKNAKQSIKVIKKKIPLHDIDIVFYDNPKIVIPHLGIAGYAQTNNLILVPLNPKFEKIKRTINEEIIRVLAHELHHCVRCKNIGYGRTLLEAMISEGLADHFDIEITNKEPHAWSTSLTSNQFTIMKKRAMKEFNNKKYDHMKWFFGTNNKIIPKWAGYTIGFNLVSKYIEKNPDKKPSQLFAVKADEFIK